MNCCLAMLNGENERYNSEHCSVVSDLIELHFISSKNYYAPKEQASFRQCGQLWPQNIYKTKLRQFLNIQCTTN